MSHASLSALFGGVTIAACISGCVAMGPMGAQQATTPLQCYWLSNVDNAWQAMPDVQTQEQCYALDSCSGGLGESGGGCYKWANGATEAPRPWRIKHPEMLNNDE